jgi:hypothetical protein
MEQPLPEIITIGAKTLKAVYMCFLRTRFAIGFRAKQIGQATAVTLSTPPVPILRWSLGNTRRVHMACDIPANIRRREIICVVRPNPPSSTGVQKNTGATRDSIVSTKFTFNRIERV